MGCGSSAQSPNSVSPESVSLDRNSTGNNNEEDRGDHNGHRHKNGHANGHVITDKDSPAHGKSKGMVTNPDGLPPRPVPKSIAFDITLDSNNINNIISKHPPKRLKSRLEPISGAPMMSADMLLEKQKMVEDNRQKELDRKRERNRKSRIKRQLLAAKEFEKTQSQSTEIEEKLKSAGKVREDKLKAIQEKQRLREERARRARDKAQKMKLAGDEVEFDVERDENFNTAEVDSWLDGDNNSSEQNTKQLDDMSERIYSGRESPHKEVRAQRNSAERRARMSASTTDSFDYAFQRHPSASNSGHGSRTNDNLFTQNSTKDDFFDS